MGLFYKVCMVERSETDSPHEKLLQIYDPSARVPWKDTLIEKRAQISVASPFYNHETPGLVHIVYIHVTIHRLMGQSPAL